MANDNDNSPNPVDNAAPEPEGALDVREDRQSRLVTSNRPPSIPAPPIPGVHGTGTATEGLPSSPLRTTPSGVDLPLTNARNSSMLNGTGSVRTEGTIGIDKSPVTSTRRGRSPDDAGSVVNATPLPLTPGPHRRELGISPVRVTPPSNFRSPLTSGRIGDRSPASPANDPRESLVLWGTTVNMEDAERRLSVFIKEFQSGPTEGNSRHVDKTGHSDGTHPPSREASDGHVDAEIDVQNDTTQTKIGKTVPHYLDLLHHLAGTGGSVLNIDMSHLHQHDPGLYRKIRAYPNELITVFDAVVTSVFKEAFPNEAMAIDDNRRKSLQVRTHNLLPQHVQSMRELNPSDISNLVAVRGMIIRASSIIPDIQVAMYCCSKCRAMVDVRISHGRIDEPRKCNSCNTRDSFTLIHSRSTFSDKQMVRLQEAPESIPKGETPSTFTLVMYDSLVDTVKPGDRVEVTGILRATPVRVNPKLRVVRSVFRTYIDCVHIRLLSNNQSRLRRDKKSDDDENANGQRSGWTERLASIVEPNIHEQREARTELYENLSCHPRLYDRLASSLAPSIFGMDDEKKGVLLQLFGGACKTSDSALNRNMTSEGSAHFRSSINILLVGDPGTSKSQLLQSAHRLAPRGVYTSGRGSSAVGLTAYVTRDPDSDDYVLESGALVLSDRGVCCIDEFDKMSDFARSVLHEAMEQQTVSIAKAGIIATLNARTAVLAAANPLNSRYDSSKSVIDNIDLPPTLLSRFDLIYLVLDSPNAACDRRLAQHIVSLFFKNYEDLKQAEGRRQDTDDTDGHRGDHDRASCLIPDAPTYGTGDLLDSKTLTDYIAYAREKVNPRISDAAGEALMNGYVDMRSKGRGTGNITATPRQLESLIRLAEAHARMQLKENVDVSDVEEAVRLVQSALHMAAYDPNTGKIDMNLFAAGKSRGSDDHSEKLGQAILQKLGEQPNRQEMPTSVLLSKLRETSDADITAGDLREALRQLYQSESIFMTNGGKSIRLAQKE